MMKFLHAADLHIDSRLEKLKLIDGAPAERIVKATRDAFENLVMLAIDEQVNFVIIAGDLFDGSWQDIRTGLWTATQFRQLEREHIPVYLIRGNHDALSEVAQRVRWPENVHQFPVDQPATFVIDDLAVALHGQGFAMREVPDDLAANYPAPVNGYFNIGVLHTSLTGDPQHDSYAPTSEQVLVNRGYDYWALGHIHARRTIREEHPYIAYSGNTQGRHINERGEKGCLLVTVEERQLISAEFKPTDVARWHALEITLTADDELDDLYAEVRRRLIACHESDAGRLTAARITVRGPARCHARLTTLTGREEAVAEFRNIANEIDDDIWLENVLLQTSAPIDLDQLRRGHDLMGDLLRSIAELSQGTEDDLRKLADVFQPLAKSAGVELEQAGIDFHDPQQLQRWLEQAEGLLVTALYEEDA